MDQKELEEKIAYFKAQGHQVPKKDMIKTPEQIQGIRESAVINTGVLDYVASKIKAGVSTQDIDDWVNEYTTSHGAICAPYHYEGYPKHVCTSINEVVCHGIPSKKRILMEGDIINVDVSTIYNGYFSDASRMFIIGETSPENRRLVEVTKRCLEIGIEQVKPFGFIGDIGFAIEQYAEKQGFKVVRAFGGHGVGLEFHEEPMVLHYGKKNTGCLMVPGMVFTIEPMINMRKSGVRISPIDGWTATTKDGLPSAQWEHTLLVTDDGCEILTY
ncbi:MAG: type I methionyl aminopeptidase [Erysipelotrichaceae bacterium]|nr:type I methionyl aminopeptidase [Erysipelotrichaceae bacterium]